MSKLRKFTTCWGQQCSDCGQMKPFSDFHKRRSMTSGYRSHCKDCRHKKYRADYATERLRERARIGSWKNQGIPNMTSARYEEMLLAQSGKCLICGATELDNGRRLCVDHDHNTGEIRGLLCDHCNTGLGRFNDDPEMLRKALHYLEAFSMKVVG